MELVFDIESTGFLDDSSIDYTASPYCLKSSYKVHCIVLKDIHTKEIFKFVQEECYDKFPKWVRENNITKLIGHNIINFDLLVLKLAFGLDFGFDKTGAYFDGRYIDIVDTLVLSKTLNADRYPGHGIEAWGKRLGFEKIDWRAKAVELGLISKSDPDGAEFRVYHPEMLEYNIRDVEVNEKVYFALMNEWGDWDWDDIFYMEQRVADIITRQQHRGFWFNAELAEQCVRDLDEKMEAIRKIVEPLIPPRPLPKTRQKEFTPVEKQFLKNGEPNQHIKNFIAKHEGTLEQREDKKWVAKLFGKEYVLPIPHKPLIETEPAKLSSSAGDSAHLKGWLVELGWKPTQYKERDLTCDSKKNKLDEEKYAAAVERYVEQTLSSPFKRDRLEELDCSPAFLKTKLMNWDLKRPLKVYTNPTLTVGQEKEIDPALLELADKFPYAKDVSDYFTYTHRRNSILGGGFILDDWDEDEEPEKGFLSENRLQIDGRIPTPADTCGAGTGRMKHRRVANIPRVTSLYGDKMRAMFGVDVSDGFIQMGYDFDSLEAKIETHYVHKYPGGPEYGVSLTANKPYDCHSMLAASISVLLGRPFPRSTAKNVKYGCSYNAQPARVAKTVGCDLETGKIIFDAFWTQAYPLKQLKEKMQQYWESVGEKRFLLGLDGRKLPVRSKGNVINTAFQSGGVICAKRAMIIHEDLLRDEDLTVDFFTEDWRSKNYCQQLIAMHDEAQLEVRREAIEWRMFPVTDWDDEDHVKAVEAEAKAEKKRLEVETGKIWSDVLHTDKVYYFGYNRAGELAAKAVKMAGEYYNLNVELTAGYMLGLNWGQCH